MADYAPIIQLSKEITNPELSNVNKNKFPTSIAHERKVEPLPHHEKEALCTTRPEYRKGRKLTGVKVYSIAQESVYLLVTSVPAIDISNELFKCAQKYGSAVDFKKLSDYPCTSEFTEAFMVKYARVTEARLGKKFLDCKNFFGGVLHVCYAPELETIEETKQKLAERKNAVKRYLASEGSSSSVLQSYHPQDRLARRMAESSVTGDILPETKVPNPVSTNNGQPPSQEFLDYVRNVPPPLIVLPSSVSSKGEAKLIGPVISASSAVSKNPLTRQPSIGNTVYESTSPSFEPGLGNVDDEAYNNTLPKKRKTVRNQNHIGPHQGINKIKNLVNRTKKPKRFPGPVLTSGVVVFSSVPPSDAVIRAAPVREAGSMVVRGGAKLLADAGLNC